MSRKVKLVADMRIQDAAQETYDAIALPVRSNRRPVSLLPIVHTRNVYSSIDILCMPDLLAEASLRRRLAV